MAKTKTIKLRKLKEKKPSDLLERSLEDLNEIYITPSHFSEEISDKLMAIDYLRSGKIAYALDQLGINKPSDLNLPDKMDVRPYNEDKREFKADIRKIIKKLRKYNL